MKTTEIINGESVVIDWEFVDMNDKCEGIEEWGIQGLGDNGKEYQANCYRDDHNTIYEIQNVEEL